MDLNHEASHDINSSILCETLSSPSLKLSFLYFENDNGSLSVEPKDLRTTKRLTNAWDAVRDFIYVSFDQ